MVTLRCLEQHFSGIEAVIFDKDGTLADVEAYLKQLTQKRARLVDAQVPGVGEPLLLAFGMEDGTLNSAGLQAVGSRRENEIAAAAYIAETGRDWLAAMAIAQAAFAEADSYLKRKADHTPPFPGTQEVLARLAEAGLKVGILSADLPENVEDFVARYQFESYVQACGGVESSQLTKPNPFLVERMCTQLEVAPEHTIIVGDGLTDIEMGRAAGAAGCIQVLWGWSQVQIPFQAADVAIATWDAFEILDP